MVLSNFITHLIRISSRPVVTAGVYSRVTLAASTHRSHLSSILFSFTTTISCSSFFRSRSSSRQWDRIDAVSNVSRRVHCWALQFLFSPPFPLENDYTPIVSEIDTTKYISSETTRLHSGSRSFLSIIDLRYFHHQGIQDYGEHDFFHCPERSR